MAIRFVDVESEKGEDAKPVPRARAARAVPEPGPEPDGVEGASPPALGTQAEDEAPLPGLPHAKPEPKPRGRKKPLSAAGAERPKGSDAPEAPLLDGLLPEFQAHAKPTPKPRGRKKAFG